MICIIADSEHYAIVNSELPLIDNSDMRYPEYASRFRWLWNESDAPKVQKELAKWLEVSQPTISDWLNGEKLPSMDTALKIADRFKCAVEYLLTGKGPVRVGTQYTNPLYKTIEALSPEQKREIEHYINYIASQSSTENKPSKDKEAVLGGGQLTPSR